MWNASNRGGGQKTFGNIGDDDSDDEDDCVQPEVSQEEGDDEEGEAEEEGDGGDQMDEVGDLICHRSLSRCLQTRRQVGNSTHDSPITCADHDTSAGA